MRRETASWLASAEEDGAAARLLAEHGFYSHAVFYTHLWVEKTLKALVVEQVGEERVERTHNLPYLLGLVVDDAPDWMDVFLVTLSAHSTRARYASSAASRSRYTAAFSQEMLQDGQEVTQWLRQKLT